MTLKIRDTGGTLRTITALKIRDASGTLRTIAALKVRDAVGTLREVFAPGGGGGGVGTLDVAISPPSSDTSSISSSYTKAFTVTYTGTATAIVWGSEFGAATITAGQGTATCSFRLYDPGGGAFASIYCDVTVGGVTERAYASMSHFDNDNNKQQNAL